MSAWYLVPIAHLVWVQNIAFMIGRKNGVHVNAKLWQSVLNVWNWDCGWSRSCYEYIQPNPYLSVDGSGYCLHGFYFCVNLEFVETKKYGLWQLLVIELKQGPSRLLFGKDYKLYAMSFIRQSQNDLFQYCSAYFACYPDAKSIIAIGTGGPFWIWANVKRSSTPKWNYVEGMCK